MKIIRLLVCSISLLFLIIYSGCNYTENYEYEPEYVTPIPDPLYDTTINPNQYITFHAQINGPVWTADTGYATVNNGIITINGFKSNNSQMQLMIDGTDIQTYFLGSGANTAFYKESNIIYEDCGSDDKVSLTSIDYINKKLSGTFSFDANAQGIGTKTISNGVFNNIPYTGVIYNNSLSAVIDTTTTWVADEVTGVKLSSQIIITGSSESGDEYIEITLPEAVTTSDSFSLDSLTAPKAKYVLSSVEFVSKSGTIYINSHNQLNNEIVAAFNFQAGLLGTNVISHTIQNGTLTVTYTE